MTLIGLSGVAGAGKDFFSSLAVEYFEEQGLTVRTFALADEVKLKLDHFIQDSYGFSAFVQDRELKEAIRPLLVAFAEGIKKTKGDDYWTNLLFGRLHEYSFADIIIVKDIRFPVELLKLKELGGSLIHISRFLSDTLFKLFMQPANSDEAKNNPILLDNTDLKFSWPDLTLSEAKQEVANFLSQSVYIWNKPCLIS